ncbi:Protein TOS1 [Teratosphaeria destructans]|uniref:glucan endo-1,3-beta-D-glucosidase n=1 Tax=Teratosphaeria destructans TaxID=418781 RepID=A0A9W7SPR7_9PEZI|nr:Protein TOS1 [Teratosphaeria destructans]
MRCSLTAAVLLAASAVADKRDLCSDGSTDDNGNWYCQKVTAITYTGVGGEGTFQRVTNMDSGSGSCAQSKQSYSGNISPLDQEVSVHFRGPLQLFRFAAYSPSSSSSKKSKREEHERRHAHAHGHGHAHGAHEKRQVGAEVYATIDGVLASWVNEWSGEATPSTPAASTTPPSHPATSPTEPPSTDSSKPDSDSLSTSTSNSDGSGWPRLPEPLRRRGSGTFDNSFGNSLSYANEDGCGGASDATPLKSTTLPSSAEVVIFTDKKCGDNGGDCGYYRPNTVAYHGFDGAEKAFFFEFQMPSTGQTAASKYDPVDMPAIWILNALIPRTLQYGQEDCSCWTSGCGEFDLFEVLAAGDKRMKSTLHGNVSGGDSDFFERPVDAPIKAAMVLCNDNIYLKIIDDSTEFSETMAQSMIDEIAKGTEQTEWLSLFSLAHH